LKIFPLTIKALEALAGFDQLGLNPATLQDGPDYNANYKSLDYFILIPGNLWK